MHLRYSLFKFAIHKNPNAYKARIVHCQIATIEQIADMMVSQGSTVGKADIVAVLEELVVAMARLLAMGFHIHLPFADFQLTIQGVFDGATDEYDPRRHEVYVSITPGTRLRREIRRSVRLTKVEPAPGVPNLSEYFDLDSGERNSSVTPGGVGRVLGAKLKFDPDDPDQGIFFVDAEHAPTAAPRHTVRVESVIQVKSSELFFKVPPLPAGAYRLQVRAYVYNSPRVRTGDLGKTLLVP